MKPIVTIAFLAVALLFILSEVECTSPMNCRYCNPSRCNRVNCECGSYKDECGCCDRCYKCLGQRCSLIASDVCVGRKPCRPPQDISVMQAMMQGVDGQCLY